MSARLDELITAQARLTPDAIAVRQWENTLTYRELVGRAATLAETLQRHGVGPDVLVGVCLRREPAVGVAVLSVLLAGGAYVPLDPASPPARRALVLEDSGLTVAVVDDDGAEALAGHGLTLLRVPETAAALIPGNLATADNAAYVMYTSGTTGRPKGVIVTHRNAVRFATSTAQIFDLGPDSRSMGFASLGFDVSVLDFFPPLSRGGSIALVPDADRVDVGRLQRFFEEHRVTWGMLPPALLPLLEPDRLRDLRQALAGGESPGPEQVARWSSPPQRRFYNWYGPTECACVVVGTECTGVWQTTPPIGHPLPQCQAYVLDEQLDPCPDGVAGELYIGGEQVGRGYLGRPALTAEKFIPDPFGDVPGGRLYRTGDWVVRDPSHGIIYIGRIDRQVKISGHRVELGEIEAVLRTHPEVAQAVADAGEGAAGLLVAYLTPADAPDLAQLREYCANRLPPHMTPTRVVRLDTLPVNASGKADLAALRRATPVAPAAPVEPAPPGSVSAAWARILGGATPRLEDDFFDCGGNSLLAMRLAEALRAELGRRVTVEDVLAGRTLGGLTDRVASAPSGTEPPVRPDGSVRRHRPTALSAAQRRVWFVDLLAGETPAYNIAFAERLRGPLDADRLARALPEVARRHEILRWRLAETAGVPHVVVDPPGHPVPFTVEDFSGRTDAVEQRLEAEALQRFDLANDCLWRGLLLRLGGNEHVLALTLHHTVFDGWSQEILYRDLAHAYAGDIDRLEPLPATFADYVAWLDERERSDTDVQWWIDRLRGAATVLDLPRDRPRPAVQTFRGARIQGEIPPGLADSIRNLARAQGTTPYTVLLTAFGQLLRRLTGEPDLIVGVPVADRGNEAFAEMIGFCVDTVPLRLTVADGADFAAHVRGCAEALTAALSRADVPLDRIVRGLAIERDLSRNPLVQVLFNMYNFAQPRLELPGVDAEPVLAGLPGSLFDLTLYLTENTRHGWDLQAVYNPDLYDADRIDAFVAGYVTLTAELVGRSEAAVGTAALRSPGSALPDPAQDLPRWSGPGLLERIAAIAAARPAALAVTGEGGELDYAGLVELRQRTNAAIRSAGISPGQAVGVLATRHVQLPGLMLGVLASGARWAMLDAALPPARVAALARAAGCVALLACPATAPPVEIGHLPMVVVGAEGPAEPESSAADRSYLSFTSGTTGTPKVILATEEPLAHFLDWYPRTFDLGDTDRFAMLAGVAYDPLLRDVFTPLVLGATLLVPPGDLPRDPVRLAAWLATNAVTVAHFTPQLVRALAGVPGAYLPALRLVACGGDQLTLSDVDNLRRLAPRARVVNLYGTTETPQAQAYFEPPPELSTRAVPVGRGIEGAQLLVRGPMGQPAGVGELGEVVVRSRHLAEGYLVGGRLDVDRFSAGGAGQRCYRTGDLGRYTGDGNVTLAGRSDDQVKVRGFRLEAGEVEAALLAHPKVRSAAAVAWAEHGEAVLHGYVVATDAALTADSLRAHLAALLPSHAVPTSLTFLPAIPLTANGKVDRRALPRATARPVATGLADEPASATERIIAGVWREVLGLPRVGATDNFFEIGGHSLAVAAVQARLAQLLERELDILDLFRHPNIRALGAHLDGATGTPALDRVALRVAARRHRSRRFNTAPRSGAALDDKGSL